MNNYAPAHLQYQWKNWSFCNLDFFHYLAAYLPILFAVTFHVQWWRHQMKTFSALLVIYAGYSPVPDEFPAQRPVTRSFDVFFFICVWINDWVNNGEAGDLRRYRAHYNVMVMQYEYQIYFPFVIWLTLSFSDTHSVSH